MKKNTGKVLSLVLAMAMAVSTFTATFASAATLEVEGTGSREGEHDAATSFDLVSDKNMDLVIIDDMDEVYKLDTMNREELSDIEYVGFTKTEGDSLVKVRRDTEDDTMQLVLKAGASGTETIRVSYKGIYTDENTDKDVTVRGTVEVEFTVYTQGEIVVSDEIAQTVTGSHPDSFDLAAINDSGMQLQVYYADYEVGTAGNPLWTAMPLTLKDIATATTGAAEGYGNASGASDDGYLKLSNTKIFELGDDGVDDPDNNVVGYEGIDIVTYDSNDYTITLPAIRGQKDSGYGSADRYYARPATTTLEFYTAAVEVQRNTEDDKVTVKKSTVSEPDETKLGERIKVTVGVEKKWRLGVGQNGTGEENWDTIAKIGSRTVLGTSSNADSDKSWNDVKGVVKSLAGYDFVDGNGLTIKSGNVGDVDTAGSVYVEGGTVGAIDADTVNVYEATVGDIDATNVLVADGAKAASVDANTVNISGGSVTGSVSGSEIEISADDENAVTIGGDVNVEDTDGYDSSLDVTAYEDEYVTISGAIVFCGEAPTVTLTGENISFATLVGDWYGGSVTFDEFNGSFEVKTADKARQSAYASFDLQNDSNVTVTNDGVYLASLTVDETSEITFSASAKIDDIYGDGTLKVNSDSLFVENGIDAIKVQLLDSPTVGAVALRANTNTVAPEDFSGVGFVTKVVAESSDVDKLVVDEISFAGLSFDKSSVEIAKGYSDTVTLSTYPAGTQLPPDVKVSYELEGDDDYITYEIDATGAVVTIKVLDYNADFSYSNKATLTATLLDADDQVIEGYVPAVVEITGKAVPDTTVTLDTTTVTKGVGQIYQFIAKSSDGSAITAASSNEGVATVALYDANDARGYKFQINAVGIGTATITATNATGATATMTVNVVENKGSLKIDTTSYTMAPGGIYDVKVTVDGVDVEPEVSISRDAIASLTSLGDGKYRITARNEGVTYVMAKVTVNGVEYGASVKVEVANGATASGVTGNNITYFA